MLKAIEGDHTRIRIMNPKRCIAYSRRLWSLSSVGVRQPSMTQPGFYGARCLVFRSVLENGRTLTQYAPRPRVAPPLAFDTARRAASKRLSGNV